MSLPEHEPPAAAPASQLPPLPVFRPVPIAAHQPHASSSQPLTTNPKRVPSGPRPLPAAPHAPQIATSSPELNGDRNDYSGQPALNLPTPPSESTDPNLRRPRPAGPVPRPRIDSFFGVDPTPDQRRLSTSPSSSTSPSPPPPQVFDSQISRHPQRHPDQQLHRHPSSHQSELYQPNHQNEQAQISRPSSFYGLVKEDDIQLDARYLSGNHPSSWNADKTSTSSPRSSSHQSHLAPPKQGGSEPDSRLSHLPQKRLSSESRVKVPSQRASSRFSTYRQSQYFARDDAMATALASGPLLDHSHLKPGDKAKLLKHAKTLELYRANAKKTNDPEVMFEFACFLMDVVKEMGIEDADESEDLNDSIDSQTQSMSQKRRSMFDPISKSASNKANKPSDREKEKTGLAQEAIGLLQKLANRGHVQSQFLLADCYTKGIGTSAAFTAGTVPNSTDPGQGANIKGVAKPDYDRAFPLFVLAGKHGHVESMYRAGQCCEHGWGTRKERDKALQFYRKAAIAQYPLAMYRLGLADLNGDLGQPRRPRDGVKWLKRAAEIADASNPKPLHELALLHERGLEHVVFVDFDYAVELLARAAELGYAPSAYKLGECYEYGRMGCPQDSALSIHYYNIAAQQDHKEACFALTAWYLVGSSGVLPQSDTEAYLWAKKAAEAGLAKAEYAVGYFTEVGIGTRRDEREAMLWFKKAAEHGDKRAKERLRKSGMVFEDEGRSKNRKSDIIDQKKRMTMAPVEQPTREGVTNKSKEDCIIM